VLTTWRSLPTRQPTPLSVAPAVARPTLLNLIPGSSTRPKEPCSSRVEVAARRANQLRPESGWRRRRPTAVRRHGGQATSASASPSHGGAAVAGAGDRSARQFVAGLPGQLDARVERGGANLSGASASDCPLRGRSCVARACTSSTTVSRPWTRPRRRFAGRLFAETADATVVIVAQRASTILDAEQIIVLDGGRIAGSGPIRTDGRLSGLPGNHRVTTRLGSGRCERADGRRRAAAQRATRRFSPA